MHFPRFISLFALLCGALILGAGNAAALVLNWDVLTWTAGSFNNSYDIDPAKPGNDITFAIGGNTNRLIPDSAAPMEQTPSLATSLNGGLAVAEKTLLLHLDLTTQAEAISISVSFSAQYTQGVNNVSFTIFDVDWNSGAFQDELRSIRALSIDGVTLIAPTITIGSATSLTGTGLSQVVDGQSNSPNTGAAGSNAGNVTISFGTSAIRSFSFIYGSGTNAPVDPGTQKIGIHDISFTPVPEINPAWTAVLSCVAALALVLRYRSKFRQ